MNNEEQQLTGTRFLGLLRPIEADLENYSRRMVFDRRDFEDALQNAVLRAFRAFDRYHDDASFRAWMFKILTNEIFTINRKRGRTSHSKSRSSRTRWRNFRASSRQRKSDFPAKPGKRSPTHWMRWHLWRNADQWRE